MGGAVKTLPVAIQHPTAPLIIPVCALFPILTGSFFSSGQPFIFTMMLDGYHNPAVSLSLLLTLFLAISLHWVKQLWRPGFWQWWVWCLRSELTHLQICTQTYISKPFIDVSWWKSVFTALVHLALCSAFYMLIILQHDISVLNWWIVIILTGLLLAIIPFPLCDNQSMHVMIRDHSKRAMFLNLSAI